MFFLTSLTLRLPRKFASSAHARSKGSHPPNHPRVIYAVTKHGKAPADPKTIQPPRKKERKKNERKKEINKRKRKKKMVRTMPRSSRRAIEYAKDARQ